jgi:HK97 family phage major capsid protein
MNTTMTTNQAPAFNRQPLGDYDSFNLARFLWAMHLKVRDGRNPAAVLGPDSFTYKYYDQVTSKAQSGLIGQDGGYLAPEEWMSGFHDIVRDKSAFRSLPVQREMISTRVGHIPVGTSEWTFTYQGDNAAATQANRTFAQRSLTLRKVVGQSLIPTELFKDASPYSDQWLRRSAAQALSFEVDKQTLIGNGQTGAPEGLLFATNVPQINASGATPTMTNLQTLIYNAKSLNQSANVPVGSTSDVAVVAHPQLESTIRAMTAAGSEPFLFDLNQMRFLGAGWVFTGVVPVVFTNTSTPTGGNQTQIFCGDWSELQVTMRSDVEFLITEETGTAMTNYQTWVRVIGRFDITPLHPEAFCIIVNAVK